MDPQKLSQLDPKLREAYQRVMGTTIPQGQPPAPPTVDPVSTPAPTAPIEPSTIPTPEPTRPEPAIPTPNPEPVTPPQAPNDQQREPFFIPQPPVSEPTTTPQSEIPPVGGPTPPATESPAPTQQTSSNFAQMNSEVAAAPATSAGSPNFITPVQTQTIAVKKKSGSLMPVLFVIVGVVFLVIYTLFWTKIFHFKLPFLP